MLNNHDIKLLTDIMKVIVKDTVTVAIQPLERNVDKLLKIVSGDRAEHAITKAKVTHHEKRLKKIEVKLKIKSPAPILF